MTLSDLDRPPGGLDPEVLQRRWELVLPHREQLLRVARRRVETREDAEDVVATALLRTVEHPGLDESRVGAFLCTTVVRLSVDVHRDRTRQLALGTRAARREVPARSVEEAVCDEAEARWLAEQLADLPEREEQVLAARVSGLSAQETSARLGLSRKATENAFTRVRQRAHRLLGGTLGGLGLLWGGARRVARPEVALVPAGVATALTFAVVVSGPVPAIVPSTAPVVTSEAGSGGQARVDPAGATTEVATAAPAPPPAPPAGSSAAPAEPVAAPEPQPDRTTVAVPDVAPGVVDGGEVYVEKRHEDETFEQSVQRCVDGLEKKWSDPLADPCA